MLFLIKKKIKKVIYLASVQFHYYIKIKPTVVQPKLKVTYSEFTCHLQLR